MPVALVLPSGTTVRVPVVEDPFRIGRDPVCDLCLWDLRVSRRHARIVRRGGGFEIAAEGRHGVYLRGERVEHALLRHDDEFLLTPPGEPDPVRIRFENRLEGTSISPATSLTKAWFFRERDRDGPPTVVERYETLGAVPGTEGPMAPRLARPRAGPVEGALEVVLSVFPPVPVGDPADAWLRFVTAAAGAAHPALARVVDGGVDAVEEGAMRWLASTLVRGRPASQRFPEGPQAPLTVVRRLRALAGALHLLHTRGVVHANVTPSHVLLRTDGTAVLVGYGRSFLRRDGAFPGASPFTEPEFLAPELRDGNGSRLPTPASDVFGLVAVGHALFTGRAPTARRIASLTDAGVALPPALEHMLARALHEEPAARPSAEDVGQALAFAEATLSAPGTEG